MKIFVGDFHRRIPWQHSVLTFLSQSEPWKFVSNDSCQLWQNWWNAPQIILPEQKHCITDLCQWWKQMALKLQKEREKKDQIMMKPADNLPCQASHFPSRQDNTANGLGQAHQHAARTVIVLHEKGRIVKIKCIVTTYWFSTILFIGLDLYFVIFLKYFLAIF